METTDISNYLNSIAARLVNAAVLACPANSRQEQTSVSVAVQVDEFHTEMLQKEQRILELETELALAREQINALQFNKTDSASNAPSLFEHSLCSKRIQTQTRFVHKRKRLRQPRKVYEKQENLPPLPPSPQGLVWPSRPIELGAKHSEESIQKQPRKSVLDELLFGQQTKTQWNIVYSSLKQNPALIGSLLDQPKNSTKPRRLSQNSSKETSVFETRRPMSSQRQKSFRRRVFKKPRDFDWALSSLATYTESAFETTLTEEQVKFFIDTFEVLSGSEKQELARECAETMDKLMGELGLSPVQPSESLYMQLTKLEHLFKAREATLAVLQLIRRREEAKQALLNSSHLHSDFNTVMELAAELKGALATWKQAGLPYDSFIYQGKHIDSALTEDCQHLTLLYDMACF